VAYPPANEFQVLVAFQGLIPVQSTSRSGIGRGSQRSEIVVDPRWWSLGAGPEDVLTNGPHYTHSIRKLSRKIYHRQVPGILRMQPRKTRSRLPSSL
jgi:hypothetical protein